MQIKDAVHILKSEIMLERTPTGRPITEETLMVLQASLEDNKNWHMDVVKCMNCSIIISGLLVPEGCMNCGSKDLTKNV